MTEYEKIRKLPFLYLFSMLTGAAVLIAVGAPFTLFLTELGFASDRIGLLGGMMPFFQVLGVAFLPLIMRFGCKRIAMTAFTARYCFLGLFFLVPYFQADLDVVFWILFAAMALFSLCRTIAEAAFVPWSQEIIPKSIRGSISGKLAIYYLPVGLAVSYLVKIWLDSRVGLDRFYPIFLLAIIVGIMGAFSLKGLGGGVPSKGRARGIAVFKDLSRPIKDRNFRLFLFSSGMQYLVFLIINLFLILHFKERFMVPDGQLVVMSSLFLIGGAVGSYFGGWLVDRHGSLGVRLTMQVAQVVLLLGVAVLGFGTAPSSAILGSIFVIFGFLFGGSITAGNVYLLNYVPTEAKESYMALSYSVDGIIGGTATFAAGYLIFFLQTHPTTLISVSLGGYETLFVLCAIAVACSAYAYTLLQEDDATGVKEFLKQFYAGNPVGVLWGIHRYGYQTSEERRLDLTHRFGGAGSLLAREELFDALHDPSFDVRYEAIVALGHLPNSKSVVKALESMLAYDGLVELQYAALTSLGRIRAKDSGRLIARFLDAKDPLLRARAIRAVGDIRDADFLEQIRDIISNDPVVDCRLAAVSALGKMKDRQSFKTLLRFYGEFVVSDDEAANEPRSKVILLALAKILDREGAFSQEWRGEEKKPGVRLTSLMRTLLKTRRSPSGGSGALARELQNISNDLANGSSSSTILTLQNLRPLVAKSTHSDADLIVMMLDKSTDNQSPHPAFLVLLAVTMAPVLKAKQF